MFSRIRGWLWPKKTGQIDYADFAENETWQLNLSLARWLIPRLKHIKQYQKEDVLLKMEEILDSLNIIATKETNLTEDECRRVQLAMYRLADIYFDLWY